MQDVFKRMLNLWSLEIAMKSVGTEQDVIKAMFEKMNGEDIKAVLAKGLREHFIPENPDSTPYNIDDLPDFMQWLHDRFGLPMVATQPEPVAKRKV